MYQQITLENGVRIAFEAVPAVRTAALGLWVGTGSRDEAASERGAAHFIEHMLFKGTDRLSAGELAERMDALGGQFNAFTTREDTCFYGRVPDYYLRDASELLCDMLLCSRFDDGDAETERSVIGEEIDMYEDSPEDLAAERLIGSCFKGSLGKPVLGTKRSLAGMTGGSLRAFRDGKYIPGRLVVALSGSFTAADVDYLTQRFSAMPPVKSFRRARAQYAPALAVKKKKTEQNHLCIGFPAPETASEDRFAIQLMSSILGGGMSSRLFQTLREKHGLCYSIYTFSSSFQETGLFGVETALGAEAEERALDLIMEELRRFRDDGVAAAELDRAREQVKAGFLMGLESTSQRMMRLGGGILALGCCMSAEELMERYDAVTAQKLAELAGDILNPALMSLSAVGRGVEAGRYDRWMRL